ncbi:hypothetical protein J7E45_16110 [Microbacterium sp. ISL-59]|uniref:hypothetical protein n=1 Tax=Microbacterium sp. ISL-59 TaxID=2819159 RepID=UPI001BEC940D|nr:hypothetical protein [Microbacterium sp. ISL-59]MBT2497137.1 hypothetical protein [Microbacterium sp. ISL-59]
MTMIAHPSACATLYEADEHGWSLEVRTSRTGKRMHVGRAQDGSVVRFYCALTITPAEKHLEVMMYDDTSIGYIGKVIRIAHALARRDGEWRGADWGRGRKSNGNEWLSIKLGDPVDVNEAFAQLTERIDLSSEVHA